MEIPPSKLPVVTPVARLKMRSTWNVPEAPANRPVPPVITPVSEVAMTFGGSIIWAVPSSVAVIVSPLAAVR
jgi:hypothetical protein